MSIKIDQKAKKEMQVSLDVYIKEKKSAGEFYPCTQELDKLLKKEK
jgi:hypothetical protein